MNGKIEELAKGQNYTAVNIGKFDSLLDYSAGDTKGKVFLKNQIDSSGAELSFQLLPAGTELPFFHTHKQNEEIYIVLKGKGQFQIDDEVFPVSEGSIIRIAPKGKRSLKSAKDSQMVYMVIQMKENSLEQWTMDDGELAPHITPRWL